MRDAEFEQRLLRVARGLEKADLVLKGGNVFNSFTGEWEIADIAVCGSVIAGIGSYKGTEEYNMAGKYLTRVFWTRICTLKAQCLLRASWRACCC